MKVFLALLSQSSIEKVTAVLSKLEMELQGVSHSYEDARKQINEETDLALIYLSQERSKNGIGLGKHLSSKGIPFVYISQKQPSNKLMLRALHTFPESYLTQPIKTNDLVSFLTLHRLRNSTENISLNGFKGNFNLLIAEINYCVADGAYAKVFTNKKVYLVRETLKSLEDRLGESFIRIHRSFLVNQSSIVSFNSKVVFLEEQNFPISRRRKKSVMQRINGDS